MSSVEVAEVDRRPTRVDDVHEHQRVVSGRWMKMLSGEWLEPCQASSMRSPDLERARSWNVSSGAGLAGSSSRSRRFRVSSCPDPGDISIEQRRGAGVVGVVVRVDQVGDLVAHAVCGGDLVHGALDVVTDRGRRVEQNDAVRGGQERRLVCAVGDPVEVPLDAADVVALLVEGGASAARGTGA